ncbi:hypothetical protein CK203_089473 [Vitis vinifera]|uniref:Uncharacterized protein n=1 Tax=Vitis vinifera TaxID=29760 RepID=A0A438E9C6_VITVI|nr:hypothetical protein CK203_089473 [Vitis vinifera]
MEAVLPVEIEMGSLRVTLEQQIPKADWAQARLDQLNLLNERRLRVADHVIKGLIRDLRGKFRPNWSGPYFIRELTQDDVAWLMDLDGNRFSESTNVDQLKSDFCRDESPEKDDFSGFDCPIIYDPLVDCCVEVESHISSLEFRVASPVWRSEPSFVLNSTFRAIMSLFRLAFRDTSLVWHSESHLQFGVQSRHLSLVRHSDPSCLFFIYRISHLAFRAVFLVWHSEPSFVSNSTFKAIMSHLQFGIQSHIFSLAFRATFSIWRSESHFEFGVQSHHHLLSLGVQSPHLLSLGVQSHHLFSVSMFRATTIFSVLAFKATISSQFRRSEPSSLLNYDVQCRPSQFDFQRCQFSVMAFKAFIFFSLAFKAAILS